MVVRQRALAMESPNPGEPLPAPEPGDDPSPSPHPSPPIKPARGVREPGSHVVQLHGSDEQILKSSAVSYLADGLNLGGGALVVATVAHIESFGRELSRVGVDSESALRMSERPCAS